MDSEQNSGFESLQPAPSGPAPQPPQMSPPVKEKKRSGWRIFWNIVLALSVFANIVLSLMLIGVVAIFAAGRMGAFTEETIQTGPKTAKIAVISVQGIIDGEKAQDVYQQLKSAREDKHVKGLIIRINSPGGMISASDQIYNEIRSYKAKTGKPVVAFMENLAASGGYYASVACDKIVAEPTAITGSIGVIVGYLVLQQLLEEKLGIVPVISKSGLKKDWPSSFHPPTEEELEYIKNKLITPAYERFVEVVAEGRQSLTPADVRRLADGSIYGSKEALDEKLIDDIGYFDDAIELAKSMAGVKEALVVEYRKPFSLYSLLDSRGPNLLKLNKTTLYELSMPEVMYLWSLN
jgi:protease-4